jgi:hypothetical protein
VIFRSLTLLFLILAGLATGCAERVEPSFTDPASQPASEIPNTSPSPAAEIASGWNEVIITAGYAETKVDVAGHFTISRNACWIAGSGAITLEAWNQLVKSINLALQTDPIDEDNCFSMPETNARWSMDGNVEVKLPRNGKRLLMERKGNDICTRIRDLKIAKDLFKATNQLLPTAFAEDCTLASGY